MKLAFLIAGAVLAGGGAVWNVVEAILARRRVKASAEAGMRELVRQKNVTLESVKTLAETVADGELRRAALPWLVLSLGLVLVIVSTCF